MGSESPRRAPSLWRIIQTDYTTFAPVFITTLVWVFYFMIRLIIPESLWGAILVSAGCLAMIMVRAVSIFALFRRGTEIVGQVETLRFTKERGWVEVSYEVNGGIYRIASSVFQTDRTQAFHQGKQVAVLVDPRKPERAVIKELFE